MGVEVKVGEDDSGFELLDDVLLSLQLLRNATVFYASIHYQLLGDPNLVRPTLDAPNFAFTHALGMDDLIRSKEIFSYVLNIDPEKHGSFKIACDRYMRIRTSKFVGDRLIDACIAYEALFFEGQQSGGNRGMAIGVACSMLIGESFEDRRKIREVIQNGFGLRNKIMHGRDYPADNTIKTRTPFIDYLRQSIVKLLKQIN